jgi:MFS family permease
VARRITNTIFLSESIFSAAFIATVTLLSINAAILSGTDALAGLPTTMGLIGRAALAVPMGWLMDRAGRRLGMVLGYSIGALGMATGVLAVESFSFALLCVSSLIVGVNSATSQQSRFIAAEVWPPDRRARVIGFIVFAGTIGAIGGPLLVAPTCGAGGATWLRRKCRAVSGRHRPVGGGGAADGGAGAPRPAAHRPAVRHTRSRRGRQCHGGALRRAQSSPTTPCSLPWRRWSSANW